MKNKEKDCIKNSYIDIRFVGMWWFGYAFYEHKTPIDIDNIECYDSHVYDQTDDCYLSDVYYLDQVKEVINSFLNLDNKKDYDYYKPLYKKNGFEIFLSPIED